MSDDDDNFLADSANAGATLLDRIERPEFSRPAAVVGFLGTAGVWFVAVMFPVFVNNVLSIDHGRSPILGMIIIFAFPFVAALGLGHILFPSLDDDAPVKGVGSGFQQRDKAEKRWKLIIAAAMFGALNVFLISFWRG